MECNSGCQGWEWGRGGGREKLVKNYNWSVMRLIKSGDLICHAMTVVNDIVNSVYVNDKVNSSILQVC